MRWVVQRSKRCETISFEMSISQTGRLSLDIQSIINKCITSKGAFVRIYNLTDNDDAAIVAQQGIFQVMEWKRDFP